MSPGTVRQRRPASSTSCLVSAASSSSFQYEHSDVGALAREGERDGAADARVGAGDQRDLVAQAAVADVRVLAVVGQRLHVGLAARRLLLLLGKRRLGLGLRGVFGP